MRWFKVILIFLMVLSTVNIFAQKERKYIRQGNRDFDNSNFAESEIEYRKAADVEKTKSHKTIFNVGDALYKQEKYEDAISQFNEIADLDLSKDEKAKIYHNIGNSFLKSQKYKESIEAYKNALRNNPNDMDTKYNLIYAQKKLQQQQQQQQQDQNQDQNQNQDQDQQKNQDQDKKDQNQDQDKKDQDKEQQQQQQKPKISKEDAQRLLQALANDEKKTQKKVKEEQAAAVKVKTEKEW